MRSFTVPFIAALAITSSACKGKPKHQVAPERVETGATSPRLTGSNAPAPDLVLPKSAGGPIAKRAAPPDRATFEKLVAMTFPGFQVQKRVLTDTYLELRQTTEDHPKAAATVAIEKCSNDCFPTDDLQKWKDRGDVMKSYLLPELRTLPDTQFEIGQTELNGVKMIYTYQLAQSTPGAGGGSDNGGGGHYAYSDAYVLYFNDGVTQIKVIASFVDDPVASKDAMAKMMPKSDLEALAKAFMDVYTHAW